MLRRRLSRIVERLGYQVRRLPRDLEPEFLAMLERVGPYTGAGIHRSYEAFQAIQHVVRAGIPGAFVECGVARGGSSMLAALSFLHAGEARDLYLYDTFAGMVEPTEKDVSVDGVSAHPRWAESERDDRNEWMYAPLEQVRSVMASTGYPEEKVHYVVGKVEDTIPATAPEKVSVLRLDTDWFESTWHELVHLYPRLSPGGALYIDDYGAWLGAREAVDRYFDEHPPRPLLHRLDGGSRIGIKL